MSETDNQQAEVQPEPNNSPAASDDRDSQQWGMFAHLSGLVGFIVPLGSIIGPLIIWQMKKDDPFISANGKEALNFQITVFIAVFVSLMLTFIVIGALLLAIVGIATLVLTIIAGVKANGGEVYKYPVSLRLIK